MSDKSNHILLTEAKRSPYHPEPEMPVGATYKRVLGYWTIGKIPLVKSAVYHEQRASKKCDVETGEDQKGE